MSHFVVAKIERLVASILVVVEVVGKYYEKLCSDIVVSHLMKKLHGLGSGTVSRIGA